MELEHRMDRLEDKVIKIDERQQELRRDFDVFMAKMDMYIKNTDEAIQQQREDMKKFEEEMKSSRRHSQILTATMVGLAIAIIMSR